MPAAKKTEDKKVVEPVIVNGVKKMPPAPNLEHVVKVGPSRKG